MNDDPFFLGDDEGGEDDNLCSSCGHDMLDFSDYGCPKCCPHIDGDEEGEYAGDIDGVPIFVMPFEDERL